MPAASFRALRCTWSEFVCRMGRGWASFSAMRILHKYVMRGFLVTFAVTLATVTFIMLLGLLFRLGDLLAQGIGWKPVLITVAESIPSVLTFSIPMSTVTACLLVFERLSSEGEITAMKACGVSLWRAISPVVLFSVFLTSICLLINAELGPTSQYLQMKMIYELSTESPAKLLVPGRFVRNFQDLTVYLGSRSGDELSDIVIYDGRSGDVEREIRAGTGRIRMEDNGNRMLIELSGNVRVDPVERGRPGAGFMSSLTIPIDTSEMLRNPPSKRISHLTLAELMSVMMSLPPKTPESPKSDLAYRMSLFVETNLRLVLAVSCFAFAMLGIPLGISTQRSPSSIGIAISIVIVFVFYLFIVLVNALARHPETRPDLLVWIPIVICVTLGLYLLRRR